MIHQFKTDKLGRIAPLSEYEWDDEGVFQNLFNNGQRFLKKMLIIAFMFILLVVVLEINHKFCHLQSPRGKPWFSFPTYNQGVCSRDHSCCNSSLRQLGQGHRNGEPLLTLPAKHTELKQTNVAIIRVLKAQVRPIGWRANLNMTRVSCMTMAKLFNFPVPPLQNRGKKTTHSLGKVM